MYGDLVYATPGLKADDIGSTSRTPRSACAPDDVERDLLAARRTSRSCATRASACPTSTASTRSGTMFGVGLRRRRGPPVLHRRPAPRGPRRAVELRRRRAGNRAWTPSSGRSRPTPRPTSSTSTTWRQVYGAKGAAIRQRRRPTTSRASTPYIAEAKLDPTKMPGEYAAIGRPQGPDDWKVTDLIATASLVGGIFGKGGGQELDQVAAARALARSASARRRAARVCAASAAAEDPEAPTTVPRQALPLPDRPRQEGRWRRALPDPGTFKLQPAVGGRSARARRRRRRARRPGSSAAVRVPDGDVQRAAGSGAKSATGHPLAGLRPAGRLLRARRS